MLKRYLHKVRSDPEWFGSLSVAFVSVATSTILFWLIRHLIGKGHAALLYLPFVVLAGSFGGARAGISAAILSFLCWNFFFLPPYYTLIIHDPKDWISLFVFLIVGAAMGAQTGRLRERERTALEREEEASLLYRLSAQLTGQVETPALVETLLDEVRRAVSAEEAALFLPDSFKRLALYSFSGEESEAKIEDIRRMAEWSFQRMKAVGLSEEGIPAKRSEENWPFRVSPSDLPGDYRENGGVYMPLVSTGHPEGVLYVGPKPSGMAYHSRENRLLVSISQLSAALLERQRLQNEAAQADALREADRLKSTLVSSVSHELKTPLASIAATVSNLLMGDVEWNPEALREELGSIGHDLARLNESIGHLVDLSRLEAGAWEPKLDDYELGEILGAILSRLPARDRKRIGFDLPEDLPSLRVDFQQMDKALQNLIENALSYSQGSRPVRVGASAHAREIRIWVEDEGPGVSAKDRERIFEKFFRGSASARVPSGTGLGLAIVREIVRFHGGRIWVEDRSPFGSRFVLSLPRSPESARADSSAKESPAS